MRPLEKVFQNFTCSLNNENNIVLTNGTTLITLGKYTSEDEYWESFEHGGKIYDLNIWFDEYGGIKSTVYECYHIGGFICADTDKWVQIKNTL